MRRFLLMATAGALVLAVAVPASDAQRSHDQLDVYTAVVTDEQLSALAAQGFELTGVREAAGGTEVQLVASRAQRAQLRRDGIKTELTHVKGGKTVKEF